MMLRKMRGMRFGRRHWLLVTGLVLMMACLSSGLHYVTYKHYKDHAKSFSDLLEWQLVWWSPWIPLVPLIIRNAQRYPVDKQKWLRSLLIHSSFCLLFSLIHLTLYVTTARIVGGQVWMDLAEKTPGGFLPVLWKLLTSPFMVNFRLRLLIYAIIVLVSLTVDYYKRLQHRELELSKLEKQLADAQLQALKMQLHPHFLFNTLNSVSALMYKDVNAAEEMIGKLTNFLNMTLESSASQEVTLKKELDFLNYYLQIEQIRFQDRLAVEMKIDPAALDARVPNLIMQPIVENAIRHGIATRASQGCIKICASRINGIVQLQVQDNGPGLDAPNTEIREGVGLSNTRLRLQQIYGEAYRFDLTNSPEGGVVATVELPYQK
jgi:two-component system, LytTR family, sensor kinase